MKTWLWIVIVVCLVGLGIFFGLYFGYGKTKYEKEFEVYASEFNVDKNLIMAVAKVESDFDSNAESSAGAVGVMQIMPATASWIAQCLGEEYSKENLYDANVNIRYGAYYLSYLISKYEDLIYALACYNAGEGKVASWGIVGEVTVENIPYRETQNFVKRVIKYYQYYAI